MTQVPEQAEWESGKLTIQTTFRLEAADGKLVAKAKGTIETTLIRRAR